MGGICGAIRVEGDGPALAPESLARMLGVLMHRAGGPTGTYLGDGIALGARSVGTAQPLGQGPVRVVADGTILNHRELRRALERDGVHADDSPAGAIESLYELHGDAFVEHLRGDFAIALWDGRRRRLVLVRDRQGIRPLFYTRRSDVVLFASELKGLLASGLLDPQLDYESVDAYLDLGFVPGPRTMLAGVSKLLLGERVVVDSEGLRCDRYWRYPEPRTGPARSTGEWTEELRAVLRDSVHARMDADERPSGAFLSGGLDSSVVLALMREHSPRSVPTFSIGFTEAGDANELEAARQVARALGAEHHDLELSLVSDGVDFEELVWRMDEPVAELSALGLFALSELASQHVGVTLSGQGADGILGGLPAHRTAAIAWRWQRLPSALRRPGEAVLRRGTGRMRRAARVFAEDDPVARFLAPQTKLDADRRRHLYRGALAAVDGRAAWRAVELRLGTLRADPAATFIYLDEQLAAVDSVLHYNDYASTAGPVEVRFPFLDHHVVEFCATVPTGLKVHRLRERKYLLKQAARGLVPDFVIERPKVGFFNAAIDAWVRAHVDSSIRTYLLAESPRYEEFLDRGTVESLVRRQEAGVETGSGGLLLAILLLEAWLATAVPRALAAAAEAPPLEVLTGEQT